MCFLPKLGLTQGERCPPTPSPRLLSAGSQTNPTTAEQGQDPELNPVAPLISPETWATGNLSKLRSHDL